MDGLPEIFSGREAFDLLAWQGSRKGLARHLEASGFERFMTSQPNGHGSRYMWRRPIGLRAHSVCDVDSGTANLFGPVQHEWVMRIPMMQQSVLFAAIRAPDGLRKNHPVKVLMRWYRRCILLSAFDKRVLDDPFSPGGGSFSGPFTAEHAEEYCSGFGGPLFGRWHVTPTSLQKSFDFMRKVYLEHVDEIPHHFQLHLMHAAQIVGVHHPDESIREWWNTFYLMIVNDAHLQPETAQAMNLRLSDNCDEWRAREEVVAR